MGDTNTDTQGRAPGIVTAPCAFTSVTAAELAKTWKVRESYIDRIAKARAILDQDPMPISHEAVGSVTTAGYTVTTPQNSADSAQLIKIEKEFLKEKSDNATLHVKLGETEVQLRDCEEAKKRTEKHESDLMVENDSLKKDNRAHQEEIRALRSKLTELESAFEEKNVEATKSAKGKTETLANKIFELDKSLTQSKEQLEMHLKDHQAE